MVSNLHPTPPGVSKIFIAVARTVVYTILRAVLHVIIRFSLWKPFQPRNLAAASSEGIVELCLKSM